MSAVGETLAALSQVFGGQGLGWHLLDAQAVVVRGAPRATRDQDVTVAVPRGELPALIAGLRAAGIVHRYPEIADDLLRAGSVLPLVHGASGMEVDVVLAASALEELALDRAEPALVDGVEVPVASATDLVVMKVLAGRGKDLDDVRALLASSLVDLDEARDLLGPLEAALGVGPATRPGGCGGGDPGVTGRRARILRRIQSQPGTS